jgi:hypothetical protein
MNTSISIGIIEHAFRNSYLRDLHIYYAIRMYAKSQGGYFDEEILKNVAKISNYRYSTILTRLRSLRKRGFVNKCKYSGYRFKSQAKICMDLGITSNRIIGFANIKDFENFRALCYSGVLGRIIKTKKYIQRLNDSGIHTRKADKSQIEIAINYMAKVLNISYATSQRIRKSAQKLDFIDIKLDYDKDFYLTEKNIDEFKMLRQLPGNRFKEIKKINGILRVIDHFFISSKVLVYSSKALSYNHLLLTNTSKCATQKVATVNNMT